jgi:hypothetical protein
MNTTDRLRRHAASAAMTAGVIAITGAIASAWAAGPAHAAPALAGASGTAQVSTMTRNVSLMPMPQGQLTVTTANARLTAYGFTPNSSHEVAVSLLGMNIRLGTLTASAAGSVNWTGSLSQLQQALGQYGVKPPSGSVRMVILSAGPGSPVIAQASSVTGSGTYAVQAVEPGWGVIKAGTGTISYDPAARTLSVTVTAYGLTPGAHAAHIHAGSCRQQGATLYTLTDFTADSHGAIVHQTRTVRGVGAVKFGGGWYFNLHQGNASNITSHGKPTVNFRPLLCSNL